MDSPDQATNDQPVLKGTPSGVGAPLDKEIPYGGPNVKEIGEGTPSGVAVAPLPPPGLEDTIYSRRRPPNQVLLSMYVPPYERIHPPTGMVTPDLEGAREIIHHWSPFNQEEPPVAHMRDLYPNYFQVPIAAHAE